jgi:hypothetical protein
VRFAVPLVLVPTTYPQLSFADVAALRKVGLIICAKHAIRAAVAAMRATFARILDEGGIAGESSIASVAEIFTLQGDNRIVLLGEVPIVLRADLYAVAALTGAAVVVIGAALRLPATAVTIASAVLCFALRFMAIRRGWHLAVAGEPERPTPNAHAPKDRKDEGAERR